MRKLSIFLAVLLILVLSAACRSKDKPVSSDTTKVSSSHEISNSETTANTSSTNTLTAVNTTVNPLPEIPKDAAVLSQNDIDLNADGKKESVTVYRLGTAGSSDSKELEGRIRITGSGIQQDFSFMKKPDDLSGLQASAQFSDLDGDGATDVFILLQDSGAAFSYNYFYIYSLVKGRQFMFNVDNILGEFASGFKFKYLGKGKLEISNSNYNFKANIDLKNNGNYSDNEEQNAYYDRSWVEPVPVEMGPDSKLRLEEGGTPAAIKVPMPIFGLATADLIGEVDLYYKIDGKFTPVMTNFKVYAFNGSDKIPVGEAKIQ